MSMIMLRMAHAALTQVLRIAIASITGSAILQNFRLRSYRRICFMMSSVPLHALSSFLRKQLVQQGGRGKSGAKSS